MLSQLAVDLDWPPGWPYTIPHPTLDPRRASCETIPCLNRQFSTDVHNFPPTSTRPIPQNSSFPLCMSTVVAHASFSGGVLSPNVHCTNLAKSSHLLLTVSFLRVASRIHPFNSSAPSPDGPPALHPFRPLTDSTTSASVGIPSLISYCRTKSATSTPDGSLHL